MSATMSTEVTVGDLVIKVEVTCENATIGWAKHCAKALKEAVDAIKKEFGPEDREK